MSDELSKITVRATTFTEVITLDMSLNDLIKNIVDKLSDETCEYISFASGEEVFMYPKAWLKQYASLKFEKASESGVVLEAERIIKNLS